MTVARLSGEQGYRFFFVTNRRPNTTLLPPFQNHRIRGPRWRSS